MRRRSTSAILPVLVMLAALVLPAAAAGWTLDLADSVRVTTGTARLADVVRGPVPAAAGDLVVAAGGRPGTACTVSRRVVLRRLVLAGLAEGVTLAGADQCQVSFAGQPVPTSELVERVRALLLPAIPPQPAEAPPAWLALEIPDPDFCSTGNWDVSWPRSRTLSPGRNLLTVELAGDGFRRHLSVVAVLHCYGRTARQVRPVARGQSPDPEQMQWEWTDLATAASDLVTTPEALAGMVATRDLDPGEYLSTRDLEPRPLVRRGETVELLVRRGSVAAVVRAECRQDGLLGETVSVRNKLNGRLVVARVAGPGTVTIGR